MTELREGDFDDWDEDGYDPDDDWYDPDDREPDEPDWGYEAWRAGFEEHCERVHPGTYECNCREPLRERLRQAAGNLRWRMRNLSRRARRDWDEPPF